MTSPVYTTIEPTRGYARSGNVHIAYQVLGDGPAEMVHVLPFAHAGRDRLGAPADRSLVDPDRGVQPLDHLRPARRRILRPAGVPADR